jgi:heme/copper-type cytochrome/quinol oxidase subunit 1
MDPWGTLSYDNTTSTLEWMVDSPPAFHTFDEIPRLFIATK